MADRPVLVVDDDEDIRDALAGILRDAGHDVIEAGNGKEALAIVQQRMPRVILLDLMMPIMDGFAFLAEREKERALAGVPVVVITASGKNEIPGATAVLQKPFSVDDLLEIVTRA